VQSFPDELTAFREYAKTYPDNCVLLVDTYNTLASGIPNAVTVAKELESRGHRLSGVRLDSGDLAYLSKHTREMLDAAGLSYVKIVVSNQLDERIIKSLLGEGAPINAFGVGTHLVTGQDTPALDGVYKLCALDGQPRLKVAENVTKTSLPGVKKVVRFTDPDGLFYADGIVLNDEKQVDTIHHPFFPEQKSRVSHCFPEGLIYKVMEGGKALVKGSVGESAAYAKQRLAKLSPEHRRFENPHVYKVGASRALLDLRQKLVEDSQKH
jgi:nicotinate phosphoribosyltransferase